MIERIRHPVVGVVEPSHPDYASLRDRGLLWRATNLAIESAFRFGLDLPVGAVAAQGDLIAGRYFASDKRFGKNYAPMHAEVMAIQNTKFNWLKEPDTVVVTVEPCDNCQEFLAAQPSVKRIGFGLTRNEVASKGLVKPHDETIFDRIKKFGYPYEAFVIEDEDLRQAGGIILDFVRRDTATGQVSVDTAGLNGALAALNAT